MSRYLSTKSAVATPVAKPSVARLAGFWCLLLLLPLLACEGLARAYRHAYSGETVQFGYPEGLWTGHETLEYSLTPGFRGFFSSRSRQQVPITINADGYRDDPFGPRTPGQKRLVFLGDSVTFGSGVRAELRFTEILEERLEDQGEPAEVMNLGVNSYTFFHYLRQVEEQMPAYRPDLVVVGFCLNDLAPKETSGPRNAVDRQLWTTDEDAWFNDLVEAPQLDFWTRMEKLSGLVWLASGLRNRVEARSYERWRAGMEESWDRWMERVLKLWQNPRLKQDLERDLKSMQATLRRQGSELMIVVLPVRQDVRDGGAYSEPRAQLLSILNRVPVPYVDLHGEFSRLENLDEHYLPGDSVHLTRKGHTVVADYLALRLSEFL